MGARRKSRMEQTHHRPLAIGARGFAALVSIAIAIAVPFQPVNASTRLQSENTVALDELFADLKAAKGEDDADQIANKIYVLWRQSGSATLDLMASRARDAMGKGELPVAAEILSRIIAIDPTWPEAWNMRATVFYVMGDNARAKADVVEVLSREPRHFGALMGLALIFETESRAKDALKTYRRVLEFAPQLQPVKAAVARLEKALEQQL